MTARTPKPLQRFGPSLIDRGRPISFRLDGRRVSGFEGDSVLSAVLAAGIDTAGLVNGSPLGLGLGYAPDVHNRSDAQERAMPMALCPARDGLDLATSGRTPSPFGRFGTISKTATTLGVDPTASASPPSRSEVEDDEQVDVLVIGGGISGLSAAVSAARGGRQTLLIERRFQVGGDALLFGNRDGELPATDLVGTQISTAQAQSGLEIRLGVEAALGAPGAVSTRAVTFVAGRPMLSVRRVRANTVIIATGCSDRVPVVPGNRLPGVIGLGEAFHLAAAYNVWPSVPTLIAGGTNAIYHLAGLAHEDGLPITQIMDGRIDPRSRFADFAKAYGIHQATGSRVLSIARAGGLSVTPALAWNEAATTPQATQRLVVSDGWRPRLAIWRQLGGSVGFGPRGCVAATHAYDGAVLIGSAAGFVTSSACVQSGATALARARGEDAADIVDDLLSEDFESADAPPYPPYTAPDAEPAYLSRGRSLDAMPQTPRRERGILGLLRRPAAPPPPVGETLTLASLEALAAAGLVAEGDFDRIAAERLMGTRVIALTDQKVSRAEPRELPDYLAGRFGPDARQVNLTSEDGRGFEPGMLVFSRSDIKNPMDAVGVVTAPSPRGGSALMSAEYGVIDTMVVVRDGKRGDTARVSDAPAA